LGGGKGVGVSRLVGCEQNFKDSKDNKENMYVGASGTCLLYIFDSDMETHVNMRRGVMDGLDRELLVTT